MIPERTSKLGKFLKNFIRILVIGLLLVGALMLAAVLLVPRDKIREMVIEKVEQATGGEVSLGDASLTFFPPLGLKLSDGHVQGTGQALALATGTANNLGDFTINLENLEVRLSVLPLLKRAIVVDAIKLEGPKISFQQGRDELFVEDFSLKIRDLHLPIRENQVADSAKSADDPTIKRSPSEQIPVGLDMVLEFQAGGITFQQNLFQDVVVTGQMADKVLTLDTITANRAGGALAGEIIVDWATDPWGQMDFQMTASDVPSGKLFSPWVEGLQQRLDCNLAGGIAGRCNLKDSETILGTLDAVGAFHSGEGNIYASDLLQDVSKYLGQRQDLKDIKFHAFAHNFSVEKGRYLIRELVIDGLDTDWTCKGWIGLKGTMDVGIRVKLPPGFSPDLGQWSFLVESLRDSKGRVPLAFKLQGRTSRPKVVMDFSAFGEMQKEAEVSAQQVVESTAKKGLSEILDKWKTR